MTLEVNLFNIAIGGFLLFLFWQVVRHKWDVRIIADSDGVKVMGGVSIAQQAKLKQFLENDVTLAGKITIYASRGMNGRLETRICGPIDDGIRQRIRNFLIITL